jgi:hypothetical protein
MLSRLKRIGLAASKVQITLEIKSFSTIDNRDDISLLFVEFERGSKSVSTTSRVWQDMESITNFDESLTLIITLYKDSSGKYVEKKGHLVVKGHSNITFTAMKLGAVQLELHIMAAIFSKENMIFQLKDNKGKLIGLMNVTASAKYLGEGGDDDDTSVSSSLSAR